MINTSVLNNNGTDLVSQTNILLARPQPLGTYMQGAFQCRKEYGEFDLHSIGTTQDCNFTLFPKQYLAQLSGTFTDGFPPPCFQGSFGNSTSEISQITPTCAGICVMQPALLNPFARLP